MELRDALNNMARPTKFVLHGGFSREAIDPDNTGFYGVLPVTIIPHYKKEYEGKLRGFGGGLQEVLLPEYQFKVFNI